jgi:hypothetical protein
MKQFIAQSKKEEVSPIGLSQLEAIMYDDMAFSYLEQDDQKNAMTYFLKALELARRVGGDFQKDFLSYSTIYICGNPDLKKYC